MKRGNCRDCGLEIEMPERGTRRRCTDCAKKYKRKYNQMYYGLGPQVPAWKRKMRQESDEKRAHLGGWPEDQADEMI